MTKVLKVIKPFFVMEAGDTFELAEDEKTYTSVYNEEHHETNDAASTVTSSYNSTYTISLEYAQMLLDNGYIEEVNTDQQAFTNVFVAMEELKAKYVKELSNIEDDMKDQPTCMKVERETVLTNLIHLLSYLISLKK